MLSVGFVLISVHETRTNQGVGTVVKVSMGAGGKAQPLCRVKWDDGSTEDYFSGMTLSRNAVGRSVHPDYDSSVRVFSV